MTHLPAALLCATLLATAPALAQHQSHGHAHGHDDEAAHAHEEAHERDHGDGEDADHVAEGAGLRALHGWTRATRDGTALVFVELSNTSGGMVRVTGAESGIAARAELVGFRLEQGRETWSPVGAIDLGPDESVDLAPFGLAILLEGLTTPLEQGDTLDVDLLTAEGALAIAVEVEAADATQHSHAGHNH
jgi:periplasmic copper chaperone A